MADRMTQPAAAEPGASEALPELREQLKALIIRVLLLEGVTPTDITDDGPLFGEGLGLDSVDALELAIHIEETFGVKIPEDGSTRSAFHSVASLAAYIGQARGAGGA